MHAAEVLLGVGYYHSSKYGSLVCTYRVVALTLDMKKCLVTINTGN